jgi:hypothetical protein
MVLDLNAVINVIEETATFMHQMAALVVMVVEEEMGEMVVPSQFITAIWQTCG